MTLERQMQQTTLFGNINDTSSNMFGEYLTANENGKGILDVDTVKGCTLGMAAYHNGGCYGSCYAYKMANRFNRDFRKSVSRKLTVFNRTDVFISVKNHAAGWYRIGNMGDPCHDWDNTIDVLQFLNATNKIAVIVTKHWIGLSDVQLIELNNLGVVFNTSVSALDSDQELSHRLEQIQRIKDAGMKSVVRVVTCNFGMSQRQAYLQGLQDYLLSFDYIIDTPLRVPKTNILVESGDIVLTKKTYSVGGGGRFISLHSDSVYLGRCDVCPDQCGVDNEKKNFKESEQLMLFNDKVEFIHVKSVIGSGFEEAVAKLAVEDGVAYRAARKNMQVHSAIILKINDVFNGFFTFQVNDEAKEFCLLQSAISVCEQKKMGKKGSIEVYSKMVNEIIKQNTKEYPMIMTVSTKHNLERPSVFRDIGFETYLNLSGYEYMVYGKFEDVRMKRLAHATMTNAWTTTRSDWLKMKKEWNAKLELVGEKYDILNPKFASRDGCWQGSNGYSNVVLSSHVVENGKAKHKKGKSFNGNASVLDPVACEVILRFFMPIDGKRIYNPFGGGVQFGFIAGSYGYDYVASEIRQNQCDVNNALCQDFNSAKWIKSDSSIYEPDGMFDLCFSCPPYYKVEKYIDYEGVIPEGELNNIPTYDEFRDTLFKGYKKAIEKLNDNRFFVIITGDSRDKTGAYYGCEAEHELFFKEQGLHIYNKIVYLECEFTRLAHAKRTLDYRKFPKREQKILVFYKGDMKKIKELYPPIGRL